VVVKDSMGPAVARFSVSAIVFDYILTGPISCVSAGLYLAYLIKELLALSHTQLAFNENYFAAVFGVVVTVYFWRSNIRGIHESSGQALRIMQLTTVMLVALLIWCPITMVLKGTWTLPPAPTPSHLIFTESSLGWLKGTQWPTIPMVAIIIAFGHSLLSMSGFETLAQVYREIASPKLKNLKITANITCVYAVICTGVITVLASMIIPAKLHNEDYVNNLIGVLAMQLSGPELLRLIFHVFVVVVGVLILSGAVNTSLIGANGVLNRVAEDGVLLDWFRKPHAKFGTSFRLINMITMLQIATIIFSKGDVYLLGEAYAFGVIWSFAIKALGVFVLRFQRHDQEYKVPFNVRIGGKEIPIGLGVITLVLLSTAFVNLFSKQNATKYGLSFSAAFFVLFTVSEQINLRRHKNQPQHPLEEFNLEQQPKIEASSVHARPGSILVAVRNKSNLQHLRRALQRTNLRRNDIVVMTVRMIGADSDYALRDDQVFGEAEKDLFTAVVNLAEKEGKPVELLVVPAMDPFTALVQTASQLKVSRLITGVSVNMTSDELARRIGLAWEQLPEPRHPFALEIITPDRPSTFVNLGPHPPRLWPEDVDRLHDLWLKLSAENMLGSKLHHRDVVGFALRQLETDLAGPDGAGALGCTATACRDHPLAAGFARKSPTSSCCLPRVSLLRRTIRLLRRCGIRLLRRATFCLRRNRSGRSLTKYRQWRRRRRRSCRWRYAVCTWR
jgi:amino acid transporter